MVAVDDIDHIQRGRIIEISRKFNLNFNGTLTKNTLQGETLSQSILSNGCLSSPSMRADIIPAAGANIPNIGWSGNSTGPSLFCNNSESEAERVFLFNS
jgi:hypothetical protein